MIKRPGGSPRINWIRKGRREPGGFIKISYIGSKFDYFLSARCTSSPLFSCKQKTGDTLRDASCKNHCVMTSYGGITRIRLKGRSSITSSQPASQAPLYLFVGHIIHRGSIRCNWRSAQNQRLILVNITILARRKRCPAERPDSKRIAQNDSFFRKGGKGKWADCTEKRLTPPGINGKLALELYALPDGITVAKNGKE